MSRMNDEDFRADNRDVHPVLRKAHWPEEETARCRACGKRLLLSALTDDLLCGPCDENVRDMERGRIA
jgi:hypothetical protein